MNRGRTPGPWRAGARPVLALSLLLLAPAIASGKLQVGDSPPDKLGRTSTGEHVRLADYRGKIVIISFWASWCGPCRRELPVLASIQEKATRDKVVVLAVNWRQSADQFRSIKQILKKTELTLISDESGSAGRAYDVDAIPHMIVVGRDGKIASIHVGYSEAEIPQFVDEINDLWSQTEE